MESTHPPSEERFHVFVKDDPAIQATLVNSRQIVGKPYDICAPFFLNNTEILIRIPRYILYVQEVVTLHKKYSNIIA